MERKLSSNELMFEGIPFIQFCPFNGRVCVRCSRGESDRHDSGCTVRNRKTGDEVFFCNRCGTTAIREYFEELEMEKKVNGIIMKCRRCGKTTAGIDPAGPEENYELTEILYDCGCPSRLIEYKCPCDNCDC